MGISSEVKDEMFIRTIGLSIFQSDGEDSDSQSEEEYLESEFLFTSNNKILTNSDNKDEITKRKIRLSHLTSTTRDLVGLQVWRGAFLLSDFTLHNCQMFLGKQVLELAAGVGLTSIVAGLVADQVIATDVDRGNILPLLQSNVEKNILSCDNPKNKNNVSVCELDFFWDEYPSELKKKLENIDIILASDVVYTQPITKQFVKTLRQLFNLSIKPKVVYIALEKRRETSDSGEIIAPMYAHFEQCIGELNLAMINNKKVVVEELKIDFPQYFVYNRVNELTLWRINYM